MRIEGSIVAIVTPFHENGAINFDMFEKLVEWHISQGTNGIVPCGTTGEASTLSMEEHFEVIERCTKIARGRIPIIAGTGSNSTKEAIEITAHAKKVGANACLVVAPYYNKPSQEGLLAHYMAICQAVDLPLIVYNVPGRTVVNISLETVDALSKVAGIIGVKDATGDMERHAMQKQLTGENFLYLSGDDSSGLGYMAYGGHGCISVVANVAPALCAQMYKLCKAGDFVGARAINNKLALLSKHLFVETSPSPVKYALSQMGLCTQHVRLPLVPIKPASRPLVDAALKHAGILS